MISAPLIRSLLLSVALAATLADANIFTSPQKGMQVQPGSYLNVTWSESIIMDVMKAASGGPTPTPSLNTSATSNSSGPQSTAASDRSKILRAFPRQVSSISSSSGSTSESTSAGSASTANTTSRSSSVSANSTASSTTTSVRTAASASTTPAANASTGDGTLNCINGIPTNTITGSQLVCSSLRLLLGEDIDADPLELFIAANLNVSAGWLQVPIPYGLPSDNYSFMLVVTDGDGAGEGYQSAPFTVLSVL